ncbi:YaiI/YqxD family protein [Guptibacillus algicola]|uniref:YaiI/YqxD family protein n=1 Tax=Guptibacillus algicola TaxID=225844 RepID=UPI001CD1DC42|nr:DUF188 domain-containing protein [Alkalihalobacillus algicola]MCA0986077.1 DUF188 domain-containing protein [Alkalihalobacillus algicola]
MTKKKLTLFVDADACPVPIKEEIMSFQPALVNTEIVFVASYAHMSSTFQSAKWVMVDSEKEEADLYIHRHVTKGDIAITQDYGLASLLLPKGVFILSPRGKKYTEENISTLLHTRYLASKSRRAGKHTKGPRKFTNQDREHFRKEFIKILSKYEGDYFCLSNL